MDRWLFLTVDGLAKGAVLACFALALVIIWRGTRIVNFAQGAMAVATTYLAYSVTSATGSYWLGFAAAILGGLVLGVVVDQVVMRHVGQDKPLNAVIVALGLLLIITAAMGMIYGNTFRPVQVPFSRESIEVVGVSLMSRYDIFVFVTLLVLVIGLALLFGRTSLGLRMRAAAFAPETARLLGVRVGWMVTLGWALAAAVGAVAAVLAIPTELGLNPHAMEVVFISAFTAAVVGGLDSAPGAVIGGLLVGLVLSYVSGYVGSEVTPLAVLGLLTAVLLLRPSGIFSSVKARQV